MAQELFALLEEVLTEGEQNGLVLSMMEEVISVQMAEISKNMYSASVYVEFIQNEIDNEDTEVQT